MYWLSLAAYMLWRTNFIFIYASTYVTNLVSDTQLKMTAGAVHMLGALAGATCSGSIWEKIKRGCVPGETLPDSPSRERKHPFPLGGRQTPGCLGKNSQEIRLWEEPQHIKAVNPPPVLTISFTYKPFSDTILAASEIYFHPKNLSKIILPSSPYSGMGAYSSIPAYSSGIKGNFPNHIYFLG